MVGKIFLFVLIGVCVAQDNGLEETGLEDAIQRGVLRARAIDERGQKQIESAVQEVSYKSQLIQAKSEDFIERSAQKQNEQSRALRGTARAMEEKAKAMNASESVFECIKRVEENANKQMESFTSKFHTDVRRTRATKLANIQTDAKPLDGMPNALQVRYERALKLIKACKNEGCVSTAVNSFATWLDSLSADMRRILGQVSTIYTNFMRDLNTFFQNTNTQVSRVSGTARNNVRRCLFSREVSD